MPRTRNTQPAGTTQMVGGIPPQTGTRQRTTRRRVARGGRGKNLQGNGNGLTQTPLANRFGGMSAQQIYDLGLRHGCELHGSKAIR